MEVKSKTIHARKLHTRIN